MKALLRWFDARMPAAAEQWRIHASEYYAPKYTARDKVKPVPERVTV